MDLGLGSACSAGGPAEHRFCDAALKSTGLEMHDSFPWLVLDCLKAARLHPKVSTDEQRAIQGGGQMATYVEAQWSSGAQIEVRFAPADEASGIEAYILEIRPSGLPAE